MPKRLDILHYALIILLLGALVYIFSPIDENKVKDEHSEEKSYLMARSLADSLVIAGDYNEALMQFVLIDSIYPDRIYLPAAKAMINQQREERMAYMAFQDVKPTPKEHGSIKETHLSSTPVTTLEMESEEELDDASEDVVEDAKEAAHDIDETSKTVLHFTKMDGAEIDYIGEVKNGKANGYGFAIFEKRGFYEGEWKDNLRHGNGTYFWQNGDIYEGQYVEGKRTGYGVYTFATGDIYKGEWLNDLRHGEGVLYNKKGKVLTEGPWIEDQAVPVKKKKKKED